MILSGFKTVDTWGDGTQPAVSLSNQITPGNNSYGTYVELVDGALVTRDVYAVEIIIHGNGVSTAARDTLVTIGVDHSAGTSYTDWITGLLGSCAFSLGGSSAGFSGQGVRYIFPVFLKAGTSIAAKASVNNGTVGTLRCAMKLYSPTRSNAFQPGGFVQSFGVTDASSSGTAITPGTAAEGDWVEIGTLTKPLRWLEFGLGVNDDTMTINNYHVDVALGDASNKKMVIQSAQVGTAAVEQLSKPVACAPCVGAIGDKIYARAQVGPSAADSNISVACYGVG